MYKYRINEVTLNNGTNLQLGDLTIIIGPNNVGKSRALRDLAALTAENTNPATQIITAASVSMPSNLPALLSAYPFLEARLVDNNAVTFGLDASLMQPSHVSYGGGLQQVTDNVETAIRTRNVHSFTLFAGIRLTAHLKTENRLSMLNAGPSPAEHNVASILQMLYFRGRSAVDDLSKFVDATFQVEIALDYSIPQMLRLRIGKNLSCMPADPRDLAPVMRELEELDKQGDGLRSFVAVLAALSVTQRPVCLVDEPEAFLHPPQAYAIGRYIADHASAERQIIVATHSADVLRGILSVTTEATVVRIDRQGRTNSFSQLAADRLREIAVDPLLASARVFDGLFSAACVVAEADADARFYQLILNKLRPNANVHFVNADNKQTVPKIATMYKQMGVRTAGIVDFDVLNNANEFSKQVEALDLAPDISARLNQLQSALARTVTGQSVTSRVQQVIAGLTAILSRIDREIVETDESVIDKILKETESESRKAFDAGKPWVQFKERGVELLDISATKHFDEIDSICSAAGLFINKYGELESMLTQIGIPYTTDKRGWIQKALQATAYLAIDDKLKPYKLMGRIVGHLFPGSNDVISPSVKSP
jgi:energy-coupling factor transporter ATP-binding protein EcfA2